MTHSRQWVRGQFISVFKRKHTTDIEEWSEKLTERQMEIIRIMASNPKVSRRQLAEILSINQSAVQKHLIKLQQKGLLKRVGPAKGGHWEIIKR